MSSEEIRWPVGDITPEQYESDKAYTLPPEMLVIGEIYLLRFRQPPVGGMQYISDYPVQVADIQPSEIQRVVLGLS